jgi:hypothetical protein
MIWALPSPAARRGPNRDQIWIFYAGTNTDHNGDVDAFSRTGGSQSGIDVACLRLDGFSSLSAPLHSSAGTAGAAVAVTHPLWFNGSRLELNVRTGGGGSVTVELQDGASGQPIAGFSDAECIPMVVDAVNATVLWAATSTLQPRADVSSLARWAGGVVVKFTLVGADLYAFQFAHKSDDPSASVRSVQWQSAGIGGGGSFYEPSLHPRLKLDDLRMCTTFVHMVCLLAPAAANVYDVIMPHYTTTCKNGCIKWADVTDFVDPGVYHNSTTKTTVGSLFADGSVPDGLADECAMPAAHAGNHLCDCGVDRNAFDETYMLDSYAGPWCFCKDPAPRDPPTA